MTPKLVLFPFPHIVFDDKAAEQSNTVIIENKKYTINEAVAEINKVKQNIVNTRIKIDQSIEALKSGDFEQATKSLENAENTINCPKCKNKLIISQAKMNIIDLACSTDIDDKSVCDEEMLKMIKELEEMSSSYMQKIEDFKTVNILNLKETF